MPAPRGATCCSPCATACQHALAGGAARHSLGPSRNCFAPPWRRASAVAIWGMCSNSSPTTPARHASRQKIQLALVYPLILLIASFAIVGFLLGYVVPDVVKIFLNSGQPLPALTRCWSLTSTGFASLRLAVVAAVARRHGCGALGIAAACLEAALACAAAQPAHGWRGLAGDGGCTICQHLVDSGQERRAAGGCPGNLGHGDRGLAIRQRMLDVARTVREGATLARGLERAAVSIHR